MGRGFVARGLLGRWLLGAGAVAQSELRECPAQGFPDTRPAFGGMQMLDQSEMRLVGESWWAPLVPDSREHLYPQGMLLALPVPDLCRGAQVAA